MDWGLWLEASVPLAGVWGFPGGRDTWEVPADWGVPPVFWAFGRPGFAWAVVVWCCLTTLVPDPWACASLSSGFSRAGEVGDAALPAAEVMLALVAVVEEAFRFVASVLPPMPG